MELRLDSLRIGVRRMEEKSLKPEELKEANNKSKSKVKVEVKVNQSIQKPMNESNKEQDDEVVEVMTVREEVRRYLVMSRVGKGVQVLEVETKLGVEIKLSNIRVELRVTRERVEKAREMVEALCRETVIIHIAHFGSPPRERKINFEVCFTAGFSGKIVNSSMNEVFHTGATREAAYSHCTMVNYSRKRVTQNPRPSEA